MNTVAGAGVTESQVDWTIESVIEAFCADHKLSRRKTAYLEQEHKITLEMLPRVGSFHIADGLLCEELDLPRGSYWCELVAELLDYLKPRSHNKGGNRLKELRRELLAYGHIDESMMENN